MKPRLYPQDDDLESFTIDVQRFREICCVSSPLLDLDAIGHGAGRRHQFEGGRFWIPETRDGMGGAAPIRRSADGKHFNNRVVSLTTSPFCPPWRSPFPPPLP